MIYIVDSWAWIEYFIGSSGGFALKRLLENKNNKFVTMECCIAELVGYCLKNKLEFSKLYIIIKKNSIVLPVMVDNWIAAAKIKFELRKEIENFGLIDSILISKQKELKCKIISGDSHFKTLSNVVYLNQE